MNEHGQEGGISMVGSFVLWRSRASCLALSNHPTLAGLEFKFVLLETTNALRTGAMHSICVLCVMQNFITILMTKLISLF